MQKRFLVKIITVFLSLLIIGITGYFHLNLKQHYIFPVKDLSVYELGTYHEDLDTNWSEAKFKINSQNNIEFSYILTKAREEPFTAFYFRNADINKNILSTTGYDELSVYLKAEKAQRISITLRFRYNTIKLNKQFPEISITKVIDYKKPGIYNIPINEFKISAWWLRYHGIEKEQIDLSKVNQLMYLAIGSCQALKPGETDTIIINNVVFKETSYVMWIITIVTGVTIVFIFLLPIQKNYEKQEKTIVLKPIELEPQQTSNEQIKQFKIFIGRNYQNPDLTMHLVQKELKISATNLRLLLKEELNTTFKNYLKEIRLTEVKRLLKESNLSISEIAYKCGFNDIPYFNRVFKAKTGESPKAFRDN